MKFNSRAKLPAGATLLGANDVPQAGDYSRWSGSARDEWQIIGQTHTQRYGLPVATIRARCGQPELAFCTFAKPSA